MMTASVAAYDGQIGQAAYAASKGGIVIADPDRRAGSGRPGDPGDDHRARGDGDPDDGRSARRHPGDPGGAGAAPAPARPAGGVRHAGGVDHRQPAAQRRGDPARRRPPDAAPVRDASVGIRGGGPERAGRPRPGGGAGRPGVSAVLAWQRLGDPTPNLRDRSGEGRVQAPPSSNVSRSVPVSSVSQPSAARSSTTSSTVAAESKLLRSATRSARRTGARAALASTCQPRRDVTPYARRRTSNAASRRASASFSHQPIGRKPSTLTIRV